MLNPSPPKHLFRQKPSSAPHYLQVLWGKKHYMKSLPDFQMLIEKPPPSGAKLQEDADDGNTELS